MPSTIAHDAGQLLANASFSHSNSGSAAARRTSSHISGSVAPVEAHVTSGHTSQRYGQLDRMNCATMLLPGWSTHAAAGSGFVALGVQYVPVFAVPSRHFSVHVLHLAGHAAWVLVLLQSTPEA